jgi:hypothetical protein
MNVTPTKAPKKQVLLIGATPATSGKIKTPPIHQETTVKPCLVLAYSFNYFLLNPISLNSYFKFKLLLIIFSTSLNKH